MLGVPARGQESHVGRPACPPSILSIRCDSSLPLCAGIRYKNRMRPTPTLMRLPVIHSFPFSFLCQLPFRDFHQRIKFSSSSVSRPFRARPSTAPRSHRSCRRRPSSPPTNASRRSASRPPLLWSSLFHMSASRFRITAYPTYPRTFYGKILKLVVLLELCAGLLRLEGLAGVF